MSTLSPTTHRNGFGVLRLLFASLVIFSHSFSLAPIGVDPVYLWSGGHASLGDLGVHGFFAISGFLVWNSAMKSSSAWSYAMKRVLRIYPALILVIVLAVFVMGPLVTQLPLAEYWASSDTWNYLLNPVHMLRGGVFMELPGAFVGTPYPWVSASLWTIPFELLFYGLLLLFIPLRGKGNALTVLLATALLACLVAREAALPSGIPHTAFEYSVIFRLLAYFLGGALIAQSGLERELGKGFRPLLLTLALFLSYVLGRHTVLEAVLLPLCVIAIAYSPLLANTEPKWDISYGMYLSGWPIQKCLYQAFGISGIALFVCAGALAALYGSLSWLLVERLALVHRKR